MPALLDGHEWASMPIATLCALVKSHFFGQSWHPTCLYTSVPHQRKFDVTPGYTKPKKTANSPKARPESSAADSAMAYLPHHANARRAMT